MDNLTGVGKTRLRVPEHAAIIKFGDSLAHQEIALLPLRLANVSTPGGLPTANLFGLIFLAWASAWGWTQGQATTAFDYYHYWFVASVVREGSAPSVYTDAGWDELGRRSLWSAQNADAPKRQRDAAIAIHNIVNRNSIAPTFKTIEPNGTPFCYACCYFFSLSDFESSYRLFLALRLAVLVASTLLICTVLHYPPGIHLFIAGLVIVLITPAHQELFFGNINSIQLGMLTAFLACQAMRLSLIANAGAGAILGLTVLLKPNSVYVYSLAVLLWTFHGQYKKVAIFLLSSLVRGAVAAALACWFFHSWHCWESWLQFVSRLADAPRGEGLAALLFRWFGTRASIPILALCSFSVIAALLNSRWGRGQQAPSLPAQGPEAGLRDGFLAVGLGVAIYLLSAPLVWTHYYLLLLPFLLYVCRPSLLTGRSLYLVTALAACALLALSPIQPLLFPGQGDPEAIRYNLAALILFILGVWEVTSSCPGQADPAA